VDKAALDFFQGLDLHLERLRNVMRVGDGHERAQHNVNLRHKTKKSFGCQNNARRHGYTRAVRAITKIKTRLSHGVRPQRTSHIILVPM
jgi:hypothetical protein